MLRIGLNIHKHTCSKYVSVANKATFNIHSVSTLIIKYIFRATVFTLCVRTANTAHASDAQQGSCNRFWMQRVFSDNL